VEGQQRMAVPILETGGVCDSTAAHRTVLLKTVYGKNRIRGGQRNLNNDEVYYLYDTRMKYFFFFFFFFYTVSVPQFIKTLR
jgi:hypothetical protein